MQTEPGSALVGLYWVVVVYRYLVIAWVLLTWIPGVAGSMFHHILGLPVEPVLGIFSFLDMGPVGFSAIPVLLLLSWAESVLKKRIEPEEDIVAAAQPEAQQSE
jgi:uncharacterized protein YggT (Ycf19 family)